MTQVPLETINYLWKQLSEYSWTALRETIQENVSSLEETSESLPSILIKVVDHLRDKDEIFPDSASKLTQTINEYLRY